MNKELCNLFTYVSVAFTLLPLVIGCICFKTIKKYLIPLFLIVFISAFIELVNSFWGGLKANNIPVLHLFTLFEFSLIFIFYIIFYKQYFNLKFFYWLIPVFYGIVYIDYKVNGLNELDNFSVTVESASFIIISLLSFFFIIRYLIFENILRMPFFWINSGILIYFSGNILLFIFSNYLKKSEEETFYMMWAVIHSTLNIIYNSLICIGFWKSRNV